MPHGGLCLLLGPTPWAVDQPSCEHRWLYGSMTRMRPCHCHCQDGPFGNVEAAEIITSTAAGEVARPGDTDSVAAAMTRMRERVEAGDDFGTNPPAGQEPREWVIRHASAAAMGHGYDRILRQVVS